MVGFAAERLMELEVGAPTGAALAILFMSEGALATSGDYERGFIIGGRRFNHILNPRTGWPVEDRRRSASPRQGVWLRVSWPRSPCCRAKAPNNFWRAKAWIS